MLGTVMRRSRGIVQAGFTLIEVLIVIALVVVILAVGVPSFNNFIVNERLKSTNAELVASLQYARSEAIARNSPVYVAARVTAVTTCYTVYSTTTPATACSCNLGLGNACGASTTHTELRTVLARNRESVKIRSLTGDLGFDNVTGGLIWGQADFGLPNPTTYVFETSVTTDAQRKLVTTVVPSGAVSVCSGGSKLVSGFPSC